MNLKFILSLILSLSVFVSLSAQQGQLWEIQRMEIPPDQIGKFVQTGIQIAELAKASNVPAEHGWHFWSTANEFFVANPMPDFASLDDSDAWINSFGEEGKAKAIALFQQLEKDVAMRPLARNFIREQPAWGYQPAKEMTPTAGTLYKFWVKNGQWEAFDEMVGTWNELWKAIDYPYAIAAYRPQTGEGGTVEVMFFHDGLANFTETNSAGALAKKAGKEELHQKAQQELNSCISNLEITHMVYRPNMSYDGPATTASNR